MPNCPGCERHVPYDRLDVHQRYCSGISNSPASCALERLEHRVAALERRLAGQLDGADADRRRRRAEDRQPTR